MKRTYQELIKLNSFEERFNYLKLNGEVGDTTFGYGRYLNQSFYKSKEWKKIRDKIIIRDNGCDLGVDGYTINDKIIIHHMNPVSLYDLENNFNDLCNPDYLICVSHKTHNAIHYSNENVLDKKFVERKKGDTKLW